MQQTPEAGFPASLPASQSASQPHRTIQFEVNRCLLKWKGFSYSQVDKEYYSARSCGLKPCEIVKDDPQQLF